MTSLCNKKCRSTWESYWILEIVMLESPLSCDSGQTDSFEMFNTCIDIAFQAFPSQSMPWFYCKPPVFFLVFFLFISNKVLLNYYIPYISRFYLSKLILQNMFNTSFYGKLLETLLIMYFSMNYVYTE